MLRERRSSLRGEGRGSVILAGADWGEGCWVCFVGRGVGRGVVVSLLDVVLALVVGELLVLVVGGLFALVMGELLALVMDGLLALVMGGMVLTRVV